MPITVVVQGPIYPWTADYVRRYCEMPLVSEVVYSGWQNEWLDFEHKKLKTVYSAMPPNPGIGARNLQILSSRNGIDLASCEPDGLVVKVRSDLMLLEFEKMHRMVLEGFLEHDSEFDKNLGVSTGKIGVLGMYANFPYHPRDHVFWGYKHDLEALFEIPFDPNPAVSNPDYNCHLRTEAYIGAPYYARWDYKISEHWNSWQIYLTDKAPRRAEAMGRHIEFGHRLFTPFPRLHIELPKHYPDGYPFDYVQSITGEYWGRE